MSPVHARRPRLPAAKPPASPAPADLTGINLNLVVALDALLTEANVTRAAERVGVTQSAMSHSLRQLRELLGDALLIRGRGGMVRTPRAEQLAAPLHRGLLELQRALRNEPVFEPATARRRFTLVTGDYFAATLLPELLALLGREAPHVDLAVRHLVVDQVSTPLESGEVDLGVGAFPPDLPGLRQQKLFTEDFVCVVREGHPVIRKGLDLDTYLRFPHVLISPRGEGVGVVDTELARRGRSRRIALRLPYFLTAPLTVVRSDHILTAPRRLVEPFTEAWPLQVLTPPVPLRTFDVVQFWHERFDDDPAHRWLRGVVHRAAGAEAALPSRASRRVRRTQSS
ncbi:LysR family transcriptional regulator [Pyxidicoccus fallax]|uniref:LysR family transcriptional regulator n=1 Tax=Pyxidicoccus fallax TaxID=394095 RepID=A0A848L8A5_9BACT|nr:LysR family transcriptional regulator [Pyxidicoccus fallax]NMO15029.1 LysR family transcriptional regulator [Pyxidicoccus fallax]NPC78051.1 LysR family transcriptional regulator [Pyxidicoccus fallax]